jgi:segregation and condensation protein B
MNEFYTRNVLEAALLAAGKPLQIAELGQLFDENTRPKVDDIRATLDALAAEYSNRGLEVKETAAGFRIQVRREFASEISRLWPERPARYSRALLETLALIAYRQPITRAEIEAVRGVAVNPNIVKTVIERNWVRVVGHRDVPGRPELLGTTREFLDYFGLRSLDELPALAELKAMGDYNLQLELPNAGALGVEGEVGADGAGPAVALLTSDGAGEGAAPGEGGELAAGQVDGAGNVAVSDAGGEVAAVAEGDAGADAAVSGGTVADAAVLEATFVDVTVVEVDEPVAQDETAQQAVGDASGEADEGAHHDEAGSGADGEAAHDAVADAAGAHDEGAHHAEAGSSGAGGEAAHDAVAEAAGAHATDAHGAGDTHAAHDAVADADVSHNEAAHHVVTTAADADDLEADRTLSSGDTSKHAAESDDSDAPEPAITNVSPDALEDAADDEADEDELSADGHGSRELVAAPRDIDD